MHNPFAEQYSKLSTYELIEIIKRQEDYQPLAIEAAKKELVLRNVAEEEFSKGMQLAEARIQDELKKNSKFYPSKRK